ncbi:hypothetical protein KA043_01245 [Candidatus Saccharibacteria bacterium]|jgi:hypothetical protein|nr:hypothetical protein [Candidatus Saccharibacteria bacterium]
MNSEFPADSKRINVNKASIDDIEANSPDEYYADVDAKIESGLPTFKIINLESENNWIMVHFYKDKELKGYIDLDWSKLNSDSSEIYIVNGEEAFRLIANGKRVFSLDEAQDILIDIYSKD